MAYIIADDREHNGANSALPELVRGNNSICRKLSYRGGSGDIRFEIKHLAVGDYVISIETDHGFITAVVIERKTWKDLSASISDGRCESQMLAMKEYQEASGCLVYYIIEGNNYEDSTVIGSKSKGGKKFKDLFTKVRHNTLRGFPYFRTKNTSKTAELLVKLARDTLCLYRRGELSFPLQMPREVVPAMDDIMALLEKYPHLEEIAQGFVRSAMVLETPYDMGELVDGGLTARRPPTDSEVLVSMWRCVPGVGAKTSELMGSIMLTELFVDRNIELLKTLEYESGGGIGPKTVKKIEDSLDDPSVHTKIVSSITGISPEVAGIILDKVSFQDLLLGTFDILELEALLFKGRKMKAKVKKVIQVLCPEYRRALPESSLMYKFLSILGCPEVLRDNFINCKLTSSTVEFDTVDAEYPEFITPGHNNLSWDPEEMVIHGFKV